MNIGQNITKIRKHFELSQREFALKLGISKATVSLWEKGKKYPSKKNLEQLSQTFNLDVSDLFGPDVNEKFHLQTSFKFKPATFNIKQGISLNVETEKLSKEDLSSVEKAIKILKVYFSKE